MSSRHMGFEISYTLKNTSGGTIYEMVYANGPSQAEAIVKAKFNSDAFLIQPRFTGKHTKTQAELDHEAAQEKRQRELEQQQYISPEEKARKENADEALGNLIILGGLGIAGAFVLLYLYILILNIFNFNKIIHYDVGLYFSNIKSFYSDGSYRYTAQPIDIKITSAGDLTDKIRIPKNRILIYEGEKKGENNVTLIALSYLDKECQIYGYYLQKPNDKSLKRIDNHVHNQINATIKQMFQNELAQKVDLIKVESQKKLKELESKGYVTIDRLESDDFVFVYKEKNEDLVESIEDKYYSDENYQKLYIQIGEHLLQTKKSNQ